MGTELEISYSYTSERRLEGMTRVDGRSIVLSYVPQTGQLASVTTEAGTTAPTYYSATGQLGSGR